jgi:hypothetical protein
MRESKLVMAAALTSLALTGWSCGGGGAEDTLRAGQAAARGGIHAAVPAIRKAASEQAIRAAKAMFAIPIPSTNGGEVQLRTLRGAIKGATCDYLAQWAKTGIQPSSSVFYASLQNRFSTFGSPSANQTRAIESGFQNLSQAAHGHLDAEQAAQSIGCSYLPG